jgi:ribose transport system permease protein
MAVSSSRESPKARDGDPSAVAHEAGAPAAAPAGARPHAFGRLRTRPALALAHLRRALAAAIRDYAIVVVLLVIAIVLSIASPHFLTAINLANMLESGAIYGIVAVALTPLLIVGEFDLSVGATFVLAGIVAAKLQPALGAGAALLAGVASGAVVGALNGVAVSLLGVNSFVATLAASLIVAGLGARLTDGFQLYVPDAGFGAPGNAVVAGLPGFVWFFLAFAGLAWFVMARTRLGRWLTVTGGSREAARLTGLPTERLRVLAFAASGLAAGIAGAILVSRTGTAIAGNGLAEVVFPAVAAVVVGGTSILGGQGAVWRTLLGVLLLECIRNGFNLIELDPYYQDIVRGGIILAAVAADALARRRA